MRKWREIDSLHFFILSPFPPPLSISYIKICHILLQNVNYGTFVANVTKVLTYLTVSLTVENTFFYDFPFLPKLSQIFESDFLSLQSNV